LHQKNKNHTSNNKKHAKRGLFAYYYGFDKNNSLEDSGMARRFSFLAVIPCVLMATNAIADAEQPVEQKPQTYSQKMHGYMTQMKPISTYVGIGLFDDMLNANVETVTDLGNFYLRVGKFMEADISDVAANVGWRVPITNGRDESGYFMGLFAGHVIGASKASGDYNRLGAGADLGYHWVGEYTRNEFSVGLGTGFSNRVVAHEQEPAAPRIFFSFSVALKKP
jgi:hypothetical protein